MSAHVVEDDGLPDRGLMAMGFAFALLRVAATTGECPTPFQLGTKAVAFTDALRETLKRVPSDAEYTCPACKGPMRLINGSISQFYGCKGFPQCRGLRNLDGTPGRSSNKGARSEARSRVNERSDERSDDLARDHANDRSSVDDDIPF